jgi:outer membrane protein OmpA-like peptidoglycan-associated protein
MSYLSMKKSLLVVLIISFTSVSFTQKKMRSFTRDFYFEYGKYELDSLESVKGKQFNVLLAKFDLIKVELIGHTDSDGSNDFNMELSRKRIITINQILSNSVEDSLFKITPKGEEEPIAPNIDSTKHQNRRVTVIAYYSGKKTKKNHKIKSTPSQKSEVLFSNHLGINKKELVSGKTIDLPSVQFEGGTSVFLPGAEEILGKVVELLEQNPTVRLEVSGHICCGNQMELSVERAKKVYTFLAINGIDTKRLAYVGYNNTQPKYGNLMDIRNRRVELKIL